MAKRRVSKKGGKRKTGPKRKGSKRAPMSMRMAPMPPMSMSAPRKRSGSMGYLLMFLVLVAIVAVVVSMSGGMMGGTTTAAATTAAPSGIIDTVTKPIQNATGLSGGTIAGIVIVCLVFLLVGGFGYGKYEEGFKGSDFDRRRDYFMNSARRRIAQARTGKTPTRLLSNTEREGRAYMQTMGNINYDKVMNELPKGGYVSVDAQGNEVPSSFR